MFMLMRISFYYNLSLSPVRHVVNLNRTDGLLLLLQLKICILNVSITGTEEKQKWDMNSSVVKLILHDHFVGKIGICLVN